MTKRRSRQRTQALIRQSRKRQAFDRAERQDQKIQRAAQVVLTRTHRCVKLDTLDSETYTREEAKELVDVAAVTSKLTPAVQIIKGTAIKRRHAQTANDPLWRAYDQQLARGLRACKLAKDAYARKERNIRVRQNETEDERTIREIEGWNAVAETCLKMLAVIEKNGGKVQINGSLFEFPQVNTKEFYFNLYHKAIRNVAGLRLFGLPYYEIVAEWCKENNFKTLPVHAVPAKTPEILALPAGELVGAV